MFVFGALSGVPAFSAGEPCCGRGGDADSDTDCTDWVSAFGEVGWLVLRGGRRGF